MLRTRRDCKVVLLGEKSTGKTCLIRRFLMKNYNRDQQATIGAVFASKNFLINDQEYQMQIWDTGGEERFQSICQLYYRDAAAAIICYDVTLLNTFQKLNYWINELQKVQESCMLYMCATKSDLLESYEANPNLDFVESYSRENGIKFFLTSSKTGFNIDEMFNEIVMDHASDFRHTPKRNTLRLPTNDRFWQTRKKKCCLST